MTLAEVSRSNTSRTMARASTMPAAPPTACSSRAAISTWIEGASAAMRLAATNSAMPASSMGRRPTLSEIGP